MLWERHEAQNKCSIQFKCESLQAQLSWGWAAHEQIQVLEVF